MVRERAGLVEVGALMKGHLLVAGVRQHLTHIQTALDFLFGLGRCLSPVLEGVEATLFELLKLFSDCKQVRLPWLKRGNSVHFGWVDRLCLRKERRSLRGMTLRCISG